MANNYNGIGILFGNGHITGSIAGMGSLTNIQGFDFSTDSDEDITRASDGSTAQVTKYDHRSKGTLEFVPASGTNAGTLGLTAVTAGMTLALADTLFAQIGATWLVDSCNVISSNTKAAMARISLSRYLDNSIP
jgi:hypothetical protein